MGCPKAIELLQSIDATLKYLQRAYVIPISIRGREVGGWTFEKAGKSHFFERVVTFAGTTMSIDLDFPKSVQLNRVEQVFNDATARDFSIRVFTDPSLSYYIELDTQAASTALNRVVQAGLEYKYPSGSRLRLYYSSFTVGKTVTIRVQVDEL